MALAVQVLGGFLAFAGLIGLWSGWDMLPTERGIAWTIASSALIAGGAVTGAVGCAISRLDALLVALAGPQVRTARPSLDKPSPLPAPLPAPVAAPRVDLPPRIEPAVEPLSPPVAVQPPVPAPPVVPVEPAPERPRFSLPSLKIGGAVAAGAAATAVAGATLARSKDEAARAVETALDELKTAAVPKRAEPVDPPVEILRPVVDDILPITDEPPAASEAPVYADVPMPADEPEVSPADAENGATAVDEPAVEALPAPRAAKDDPLAAFEEELDRLIPLRPSRSKKGRKGPAEAEAVPEVAAAAADHALQDSASMEMPATEAEPAAEVLPVAEAATAVEAAPVVEAVPAAEDSPPVQESPALPELGQETAPPVATTAPAAPQPEVVGAYESGGAKYTMYSDGSVVAEAEGQTLHFRSLEELREFIDGGAKLA